MEGGGGKLIFQIEKKKIRIFFFYLSMFSKAFVY